MQVTLQLFRTLAVTFRTKSIKEYLTSMSSSTAYSSTLNNGKAKSHVRYHKTHIKIEILTGKICHARIKHLQEKDDEKREKDNHPGQCAAKLI